MVPQRRRSQDWGALAILCGSPNCAPRASGVGKQTIRRGRHEFRAKKTERITQQERALEPVGPYLSERAWETVRVRPLRPLDAAILDAGLTSSSRLIPSTLFTPGAATNNEWLRAKLLLHRGSSSRYESQGG